MLLRAILVCFGVFTASALPVEKPGKATGPVFFLPDNVIIPQKYQIEIDVSKSFETEKPEKFTGSVDITALVNAENVKEIVLHSANIIIADNSITVEDTPGSAYYASHSFDEEKQFLKIQLNKALQHGSDIKIRIKNYEGKLHTDMHGFYVSSYDETVDNKKVKKYVLTTQFQPTHARKAFPCFDEPKYKATFQITFKKEKKYKIISNTYAVEANNGENSEVVSFKETPKMSTYLVAFIVHNFKEAKTEKDNYNIWSRPEANEQTKSATYYMYKIVENLSEFTGIKYEQYMEKMDQAALPDFSAGAMENWGLLTYRETALLVDEKLSTNKDIQRVVSVISHEVAHQWFGDLVTLTWWDNTWLNEGFARYFEYHTTENVTKDWEMKDQFVVEQQQAVFGVDALAKSTPLTYPVYTPTEISSHFGSISYNKGGSVIRMMEHFLGSDIFQEGLKHYLDLNRLKNTVPENLFSAIQFVIDKKEVPLDYSLQSIMSSWIAQAGYPVINVKSDGEGHFDFSQERFYLNPDENKKKADQSWFVPISYTTSKSLNFADLKPKFWLTPHDSKRTISDKSDYVIVNIQESGYYRVNYDVDLWKKIAEALASDDGKKIHHLNKAQLIDDALNLARAGKLDYQIAFGLTDYLAEETNYYPWYSTFQAFRFLLQRYSDTDATGIELRTYLKNLMEILVEDKNFDEKETKQIDIFNKVAALEWACNLGHDTCITKAKTLFNDFKSQNTDIPKNLKSIVYCTAIRNGTEEDWNLLWNKFQDSNVAAEKIGIINALGCTSDEKIMKRFLDYSIDSSSGIRKQDAYYVFSAIFTGGNSKGVDVAFKFLEDNYKKIIENYNGMNDLEKAVLGIGARLTDDVKIKEFKDLLNRSEDFSTFKEAAIETVDENIAWAKRYNKVIGEILSRKRNSATGIFANKYVVILLGFISIYTYIFN